MFCSKCGGRLSEGAKFCAKCGTSVSPAANQNRPPQGKTVSVDFAALQTNGQGLIKQIVGEDFAGAPAPEYQKYPHPYHHLGGWLAFIAYAQLVMVVLLAVSFVIVFFELFTFLSYLGGVLGAWVFLVALIMLAGFALCAFIGIKFFLMIKNKNPRFLRFFELLTIVSVSISVVGIVLTGFQNYLLDLTESIRDIFSVVIGFFIWTTYFRKSVRVRTYFGSDEYLRRSIFFKNAVAPQPADTQPYTTRQAYPPPADRDARNGTAGEAPGPAPAVNAEAMAYCGTCGAKLTAGARFCGTCGEIVAMPSYATVAVPAPPNEPSESAQQPTELAPSPPPTPASGPELAAGNTDSGFFGLGTAGEVSGPAPAVSAEAIAYCGRCGAKLKAEARFCSTCGEIVAMPSYATVAVPAPETSMAEAAVNAEAEVYCGKCGAKLTPDARFCGTCGEIIAMPS
ncbi:MAG: zinc-ribbon domain-containing protein [Oscillospiraceae bacterium]|jgi:predicted amidophosphoribosyltransferase|nr:zinc-ribbon domain-containing protein [Oscillospiraceae bacterium]